ncbi:very short patch repair endonuclease [Alcaligenes aquatilis]|uniref:very short patch repair endonuclease n=1 Tax=Alcaligenes aquatilis TaxID=323284 RepID=UPI000F6724C4|nr:very short patch repair endonuclease [Alcaligenes aquatilis]QXR36358.1 very short patch repair endonuclease [Alcaligenes aquatilis]
MRVPTTPQRSRMMSSIRGKNTWPERTLRAILFSRGFRYRLNFRKLPGSPDMMLPKYRALVFVHGCFWHRHDGCRYTATPRTNSNFWRQKFQGNIERDRRHMDALKALNWRVAIVWECALKHSPVETACMVEEWLHGNAPVSVVGQSTSASSDI